MPPPASGGKPGGPKGAGKSPALQGKFMGVPVWVLAVAAAGLYLLYRRQKAAQAAAAAAGAGIPAADTGVGQVPVNNLGGGMGGGMGGTASHTGFDDNQSWEKGALAALIGAGSDPLAAARALSDFLNSNPLDPSESTLIDNALRQVGSPPFLPLQVVGSPGATAAKPVDTPAAPAGPPAPVAPPPVPAPASAPIVMGAPAATPTAGPGAPLAPYPGAVPIISQGQVIGENFPTPPGAGPAGAPPPRPMVPWIGPSGMTWFVPQGSNPSEIPGGIGVNF